MLQILDDLFDLSEGLVRVPAPPSLLKLQQKFMRCCYFLVGADQLFIRNRL